MTRSGPSSSRSWPRCRSRPATSAARTAPSRPTHDPGQGRRGCWSTPTPTRSGCPTRACRSSTRSSTSAPTPSPSGPTPRGPTSRSVCAARACRCSRSTPTGRPTSSTCSPSTSRPSSSTRTSSTASTWPACPCGPPTAPPTHPLVGAGGHCTYNPEPLADFLDFVVLGDGEEVVGEITEVVAALEGRRAAPSASTCCGRSPASRASTCRPCTRSATCPTGASRPRCRSTPTCPTGSRSAPSPTWPTGPTPSSQLVPLTEVVHDRLNVEVFRGCTRGCRFCQAGMITRPVRERPADQVRTMVAARASRRTGYDEVALTSPVHRRLLAASRTSSPPPWTTPTAAATCRSACPSLRVDAFTVGIAAQIQKARRTGLTFAPEAGTWRMRQVINKLIPEEDLYGAVDSASRQGWRRVKLYFLTGLPTETDEDTLGIAELARSCVEHRPRPTTTSARRSPCRVGGFVPKPFTPFQWFGQNTEAELQPQGQPAARRPRRRPRACSSSGTTPRRRWSRASSAAATGGSARSSRTSGARGGTFQEWSEHFDLDLWERGHGARTGSTIDWYVLPPPHRGRGPAVGPPLGRPPQGLPLAGLARRPRRGRPRGLPLDALLRLRRLHRLRHRARRRLGRAARRRQPGHRPGPRSAAARCPVTLLPAQAGGGRAHEAARPVRQARQGPLPVPPRRRPGLGAGAAPGRAARVAYSEGFSPRPKLQLRAGPLHRLREPRRVPRHRPRPSDRRRPTSCPALARPRRCPPAWRRRRPSAIAARHRVAAAGGHQLHVARSRSRASTADRGRARGRRGRWRPTSCRSPCERKGSSVTDDAPPRHPQPVAGPTTPVDARSPSWPPSPAASDPRELLRAARSRPGARARVRANAPMDVGRRRPLRADPPRGPRRKRRDVGPARGSACVMRRERTHDRTPHRRHRRRHHARAARRRRRLSRRRPRRPRRRPGRQPPPAPTTGAADGDASRQAAPPRLPRRPQPQPAPARGDAGPTAARPPTAATTATPSCPTRHARGSPRRVEAADAALVRRPAAEAARRPQIGDSMPVPDRAAAPAGARRRRRTSGDGPAKRKRRRGGRGRGSGRRRRRRRARQGGGQRRRARARGRGKGRSAARRRPCSPPAASSSTTTSSRPAGAASARAGRSAATSCASTSTPRPRRSPCSRAAT